MATARASLVLRHVRMMWNPPGYEVSSERARAEPKAPVPPVIIIVLDGAISSNYDVDEKVD